MQLTNHASLLMRMALGEFREKAETFVRTPRQYHNRITVWRDRSDSTRVMKALSAHGWAREQESTEKQLTYAITPTGVRALIEHMEA